MVSHKEDSINFAKLEEQLDDALEADARYWRENDAKFRAVNQKVATYDEFKDIVAAAHLKPLDKDDRFDKIEKFTQPWNIHAGMKSEEGSRTAEKQDSLKGTFRVPKNGHEFAREWRRHCTTNDEKFCYILQLGASNLESVFKSEISLGLLGEITGALNAAYNKEYSEAIFCVLQSLSKVNRFSLSVQFLTSQEKENLSQLFEKLCNDLNTDSGESEKVDGLKQKYEINN